MSKEQNPQNNNRNIRFSNQMIEQINIALEQKGSEISQPGSLKPAVGDNVRKRHIHQLKVMKNEHPAFFLRTGRYCKFISRRQHCRGDFSFYHFSDSDRLRVGSITD